MEQARDFSWAVNIKKCEQLQGSCLYWQFREAREFLQHLRSVNVRCSFSSQCRLHFSAMFSLFFFVVFFSPLWTFTELCRKQKQHSKSVFDPARCHKSLSQWCWRRVYNTFEKRYLKPFEGIPEGLICSIVCLLVFLSLLLLKLWQLTEHQQHPEFL